MYGIEWFYKWFTFYISTKLPDLQIAKELNFNQLHNELNHQNTGDTNMIFTGDNQLDVNFLECQKNFCSEISEYFYGTKMLN